MRAKTLDVTLGEKRHALDLLRLGKHIEKSQPLDSIPAIDKPIQIARKGGWLARNINEFGRAAFNDWFHRRWLQAFSRWVEDDQIDMTEIVLQFRRH